MIIDRLPQQANVTGLFAPSRVTRVDRQAHLEIVDTFDGQGLQTQRVQRDLLGRQVTIITEYDENGLPSLRHDENGYVLSKNIRPPQRMKASEHEVQRLLAKRTLSLTAMDEVLKFGVYRVEQRDTQSGRVHNFVLHRARPSHRRVN